MMPKDYVCDGQMNLWEYMQSIEREERASEVPTAELDDSICEGCKWREVEGRELEVDKQGQTWVYKCPGTACANWKHGTPLNLTALVPDQEVIVWYEPEDKPYCFNKNWLPPFEMVIETMSEWFGIEFKKVNYEYKGEIYNTVYQYKCYGGSKIELDEDVYIGGNYEGERFIGVDWEAPNGKEGTACGCLSLWEVERCIQRAINRAVEYKERQKTRKKDDDDE